MKKIIKKATSSAYDLNLYMKHRIEAYKALKVIETTKGKTNPQHLKLADEYASFPIISLPFAGK